MAERTILKHEDSSKETWQNTSKDSDLISGLRDRLSLDKKFSVKYKATDHGTLKFGKLKSRAGGKAFGVSFTQEF